MTISECPPLETLEEVSRLAPGDPRRAHLESCPRCHARWTALQSFLSGRPVPEGARLDAASARLVQSIRSEALGKSPQPVWEPRRSPRGRSLLWLAWRPAIGIAAACLLVVAGARILGTHREAPAVILRGEQGAGAPLAPDAIPNSGGGVELRWHAFPGADAYRVVLFRSGLDEFARLDAGRDTSLVLTPQELAGFGRAGAVIFWRVAALRGGDPLSISPPSTLPLP